MTIFNIIIKICINNLKKYKHLVFKEKGEKVKMKKKN